MISRNEEIRILSRFLKDRCCNDDIYLRILENVSKNKDIYDIIDKSFSWHSRKEGYSYFYFLQLDLIYLLCEFDLNGLYVHYYNRLIKGYGAPDYHNNARYKWHESMYYEFYKKIGNK